MAKQVTLNYNDLKELKYVVKSFTNEKGEEVKYYQFRLYYTPKNYIRLTFGEEQKQDKQVLTTLVKYGVIEEIK